jgi:universal stress protein A
VLLTYKSLEWGTITVLSWRRLCCPIDFSNASRTALEHAACLARDLDGELTLVHVRPAPTIPEDRERELDARLAAWAYEAEWRANREVASTVLRGQPVDEIVRLAREGRFDVLVLGTHGLIALGSLVEQVMRQTSCPVVVVREDFANERSREVAAVTGAHLA